MNDKILCDGCNVRPPFEHRCHGSNCNCDSPVCMEKQGKITHEELMEIVNSKMSKHTASPRLIPVDQVRLEQGIPLPDKQEETKLREAIEIIQGLVDSSKEHIKSNRQMDAYEDAVSFLEEHNSPTQQDNRTDDERWCDFHNEPQPSEATQGEIRCSESYNKGWNDCKQYVLETEKEAECDVEGCVNIPVNGGVCWRDTGYWCVCSKHSEVYRKGDPQPKMKQEAIDRENSRDEGGCLPINNFYSSLNQSQMTDTNKSSGLSEGPGNVVEQLPSIQQVDLALKESGADQDDDKLGAPINLKGVIATVCKVYSGGGKMILTWIKPFLALKPGWSKALTTLMTALDLLCEKAED